jgi:hypothetical protein
LAQDEAVEGDNYGEGMELQRRFSYRGGAAGNLGDAGKSVEGAPGRSRGYESEVPEGGERPSDKSDVKNEMGTRPGSDTEEAGYADLKKRPAATAAEATGEKSKVAQRAQQGGGGGGEADKELQESPPQSPASESGQGLGLKPKTADKMEGDQALAESEPDVAYKRLPQTMDALAVPGKAPQGKLVVNILFRYSTTPPAAAAVAEPAGENK